VTGDRAMTVKGSMKPRRRRDDGRVIGTVSKMAIAVVVWIVLSVAAFVA